MKYKELSNGVKMPMLIQGIPLADTNKGMSFKDFHNIIRYSIECGIRGFDTSSVYGPSEEALGKLMPELDRSKLFITTKISNEQQQEGNIDRCIERALRLLQTEYIDCMLFHWPYPGYEKRWKFLEKAYEKGMLRSIGIANTQERHVYRLSSDDIAIMPHVMQTEIHPFRTVESMRALCDEKHIALQACSSLMEMRPMVTRSKVLQDISDKYGKSIAQIVLRWHVQRGIAPVFRAFNRKHIEQSANIFDFELDDFDMIQISNLNKNFRLHVESMNCPGY
ncbi:MAG: aldo/keto reductase [Bacteroidales bacterium]|nr:aldo/keto reductase [Bacteroidales bacterium]